MAGSGGSINDDLQHCGFVPDDDNGNRDGGPCTQLTKASASAPLPSTGGSPTLSTTSTDVGTGGAAKRQRSLTSDVWHYLDALSKDVGGKPVRYGSCCKFCKKELSNKSTSGTGHLLRHVSHVYVNDKLLHHLIKLVCILLLMVVWHTLSTSLQ
jgi:hypothetical protein